MSIACEAAARAIVGVPTLLNVTVMHIGPQTDEERYWTEFAAKKLAEDGYVYGWSGKHRATYDLEDVSITAAEMDFKGDWMSDEFLEYYASSVCLRVRDWYNMEPDDK